MAHERAYLEPQELPPLITVKQAEATGAGSARKLRELCESGTLKAKKLGTDWRINRDFFLSYFGLAE